MPETTQTVNRGRSANGASVGRALSAGAGSAAPGAAIPRSIPGLTGIRGAAACWVMLFHLWVLDGTIRAVERPLAIPVLRDGWVGVDLFFILSGFILMHAHTADFAQLRVRNASKFYLSRFMRVYPLSAAVLLLIALLVAADRDFAAAYAATADGNLSAAAFLKTLTLSTRWLLPGNGEWNEPVWSLSAEIVGYAAFPLLAYLLGRYSTARTSALIVVACLGALLVYACSRHQAGQSLIDSSSALVRMGTEFIAGMALYRLRTSFSALSERQSNAIALGAVMLVAALIAVPYGNAAMPFSFALLIFALSFESGGAVHRFFGSRALVALGRISFPLYLIHVMPLKWMNFQAHQHGWIEAFSYPALALWYVAAMIVLAALLHRFVERPLTLLSRNISRAAERPFNRRTAARAFRAAS